MALDRQKYFEHHLCYEIWMLGETYKRLNLSREAIADRVEANATHESFCIHARLLIEFFVDENGADYYTSIPYVRDEKYHKPKKNNLNRRLNNQIAHILHEGREDEDEKKIGPDERSTLFRLLGDDIAIFKRNLKTPHDTWKKLPELPVSSVAGAHRSGTSTTPSTSYSVVLGPNSASKKSDTLAIQTGPTAPLGPSAIPIPENLQSLHRGEEQLRQQSLAAISAADDLSQHAGALESSMNVLDHFAREYATDDHDALAIQHLGIRIFNGTASALKLLLSGYYQTAALQIRDMLETAFLLDYFSMDASLISVWRTATDGDRWKNFKPYTVRKALNTRDGFKEDKRGEYYRILSTYAGHASPKGFAMLRPSASSLANIGPFFDQRALKGVLEEMAKHVVPAVQHFMRHFESRNRSDYLTEISFMEVSGKWAERFLGAPYDAAKIEEVRSLAFALDPGFSKVPRT